MGTVPTSQDRPASPRISVALVVCLAVGMLAGTVVHSAVASISALVVAVLTWRWGPLVGGIVAGAASAAIVMVDPELVHPLPTPTLGAVVTLMLFSLAAGMIAARDSDRSATPRPARPLTDRGGETPRRGSRQITGDYPRYRGGAEPARERRTSEDARGRPVANGNRRSSQRAAETSVRLIEYDVLQRFLRDIRDVLGADEVVLWQHIEDGDQVRPYAAAVQDLKSFSLETKPPIDTLVHSAASGVVASNYDNEPSYFLAVPAGAEGRFHGALGVYAESRHGFARDRAKTMMRGFSANLAELLNLLYDGRETRRHKGKTERVAEASERIQKSANMDLMAAEICRSAKEVTGATRAAYVEWDSSNGNGFVRCMDPKEDVAADVSPDSLVGIACKNEKGIMLRENFRSTGTPLFAVGERGLRSGSVAVAALREGSEVLGAIVVESLKEEEITSVEAGNLKLLAKFAFAAVKNIQSLERAQGQALTDALTGLPNRHAFDLAIEKLSEAPDAFSHPATLIMADVDKFKSVNDTYGHEAGDEVLKAVSRVMSKEVRAHDTCFRYGGEELAVLLPGAKSGAAAEVAERLRKAIAAKSVVVAGRTIQVTVSFGVACHPEQVFGFENLFKAADDALYAAKNAGRNCVKVAVLKTVKTES